LIFKTKIVELWRMELVICPICEAKGLLQANGTDKISIRLVVCANESYIHWSIGGRHFLTRTKENRLAEYGEEFAGSGEMAISLN
jgi:hypothetical protein